MKRERTLNLAWPLVVLLAVLLLGGGAWGVGAILFEDPATRKSYPSKTVAGFLGTTSGTVDIQTMPQPTEGEVLTAGCGTSSATSTNTASCARFRPATGGSSLPTGAPGQVAGIKTVTVSTTTTGTATATASATAYEAVNGTLYAGTNVRLTQGTNTTTSTAVDISDQPKVHLFGLSGTTGVLPKKTLDGWGDSALSQSQFGGLESTTRLRISGDNNTDPGAGLNLSYLLDGTGYIWSYDGVSSTRTPLAFSGSEITFSPGTYQTMSVPLTDGDPGQCLITDGSGTSSWGSCGSDAYTVKAYSTSTPQYLSDAVTSSNSSVTLSQSWSGTAAKVDIRANFGSSANTVCQGNDSRLSNARTPTAHASTHITDGTDVIANAVASGASGLMTGADKAKLDSTTTTPTAYSIPATGSTKYLNTWIQAASASVAGLLSTAHYNLLNAASADPGVGVISKGDANGRLDKWVVGRQTSIRLQANSETVTIANNYTWQEAFKVTFTATGTKFRVHASGSANTGANNSTARICGLCIAAENGSSASTLQAPCGWLAGEVSSSIFYNTLITNVYFIGDVNVDTYFTLSTGQATFSLRGYAINGNCVYNASALNMIIEEYN